MSAESYVSDLAVASPVADTDDRTSTACEVFEYRTDGVLDFGEHHHREHQLVWMRRGRMRVVVGASSWHVHSDHLVWLPGGAIHHITLLTEGSMISLYSPPERTPDGERWTRPQPLTADPLAVQLLTHLTDASLPSARRRACQELLYDVMNDSTEGAPDALVLPHDHRARTVARAIIANPGDQRTLTEWARELGVSEKTILRGFAAETAMTYGRWRTRARMLAAVELLDRAEPVHVTAAAVGYTMSSGFISAFTSEFGVTPARYSRASQNSSA